MELHVDRAGAEVLVVALLCEDVGCAKHGDVAGPEGLVEGAAEHVDGTAPG